VKGAMQYIHWVVLVPITGFAAFLFDGIYVGAIAAKTMRNIMLVATVLFFFIYFIFEKYWGNNSLWIALLLFLFVRSTMYVDIKCPNNWIKSKLNFVL